MAESVAALVMEMMWHGLYIKVRACNVEGLSCIVLLGEGRHEDCVSPTTMYLWKHNHQYL